MGGRSSREICLLVLLFAGGLSFSPVQAGPSLIIASTDHPPSWYVTSNFQDVDQNLRWNPKDRTLAVDVAYTLNGETPNYEEPTLYHPFTLHFPSVRLDDANQELYYPAPSGRKIPIGHLQSFFFGRRVVLDGNVSLSVHRRHGVLEAMLVVDQAGAAR